VPRSLWQAGLRDGLADRTASLSYGDVTDFSNFGGAVIDRRAFDRLAGVVRAAHDDPALDVLAGGTADDTEGFFVRPTVLVGSDPRHEAFVQEYFGPVLSVFVYDDADWDATLDLVDSTAPYALTGAVFADDAVAVAQAADRLRFTAGNFYVNDKPTGAVVGQQPFGGARASGTNDKAGSVLNLQRWVSPRAIKETFAAPTTVNYPHQAPDTYSEQAGR
jgi:1-pyrroline-5-carboxylate dehydrogenase